MIEKGRTEIISLRNEENLCGTYREGIKGREDGLHQRTEEAL